jgi:hypothetical protein
VAPTLLLLANTSEECSKDPSREVFMATETELFYLVLLIFLTLIIHLILSMTDHRRDGKSHR